MEPSDLVPFEFEFEAESRPALDGGNDVIRQMGVFPYTPPPGIDPDIRPTR